MGSTSLRDAEEFDPQIYSGEGGGLLGMLQRYMQQQNQQQQGVDFGSPPSGLPNQNPDTTFSPQGGMLGRLLSLQAEQSAYQPNAENNGQAPSVPPDPNFRQLTRMPNAIPAEQPPISAEAASIDPVDIAKSAGIGFVNGVVNAVGLPGDLLTGFGHFPKNLALNLIRMRSWLPPLPRDAPDYLNWSTSGELRHRLENHVGELYQPQSRAGRYAETIGEMAPMVVGGEVPGVIRGAQAAGAALRVLPGILSKHAVAPGIAVQALEEALPDSKVGQTLQKAYPVVRRGVPLALAAERYLSRRIAP